MLLKVFLVFPSGFSLICVTSSSQLNNGLAASSESVVRNLSGMNHIEGLKEPILGFGLRPLWKMLEMRIYDIRSRKSMKLHGIEILPIRFRKAFHVPSSSFLDPSKFIFSS